MTKKIETIHTRDSAVKIPILQFETAEEVIQKVSPEKLVQWANIMMRTEMLNAIKRSI